MDPNLNTGTGIVETDPSDLEAIEAALGELEIESTDTPATITEVEASEEGILEALDAREDAVAGMEVSDAGVSEAPAEAAPEKKARKAKDPSAPKAPRAPRELEALPDDVFALEDGGVSDKAVVIGMKPSQKKVQEKFENLFQAIAAGKLPSVYTMACFNVIAEKGTCTQGDLVTTLMATSLKKGGKAYNEGTARSQAGQMMVLFDVVKIAKREKNTLTFNANSTLAKKLKALPSA